MVAQRILCLRLPNWPIQVLRRRLHHQHGVVPPVALHTAVRETEGIAPGRAKSQSTDLQFLREIFPAARSGPTIVAVCQTAYARGVRPGLPLAEARSLAAPVSRPQTAGRSGKQAESAPVAPAAICFSEWDGGQDRQELTDLSELVRRFAPVVGLDDMPLPDSLLLDITGCAPLFGSEVALATELLEEIRRASLSGVAAIADTIAAAWAIAHWEVPRTPKSGTGARGAMPAARGGGMTELAEFPRVRISLPGRSEIDLEPLPVKAARLPNADCEILHQLGVQTIRQLHRLPMVDLPARLSPTAVLRIRQLRGTDAEQILPIPEPSPIQSEWLGESPAQGLRDLHWILEQLTVDIGRQLETRRRLCSTLECCFFCVEGPELQIRTGLVRPESTAGLLADVIKLRLDYLVTRALFQQQRRSAEQTAQSLEFDYAMLDQQPLNRVRLIASSVPIPPSRQRDLFGSDDHIAWTDELSTLLSRLTGRLSEENVRYVTDHADARPEKSILTHRFPEAIQPNATQATERLLNQLTGLSEATAGSETRTRVPDRKSRRHPGRAEPVLQVSDTEAATGLSPATSAVAAGLARPIRMLATPLDITAQFVRDQGRTPSSGSTNLSQPTPPTRKGPARTTRLPKMPLHLQLFGFTWTITQVSTPERIQTAWWTDAPCHRDYFQMTASTGARLWIFRDLQTDHWFLHGLFD